MPLSQVLIDGEKWQIVSKGHQFTEGPAVDKDGNIYFTDVPKSEIYRIDAKTLKVKLFVANSHQTNGLMFGPKGKLHGCQNGKKRIVTFDSKGKTTTVVDGVQSNDIAITKAGGIYFTDPTNHRVWYASPDGKKKVVDKGLGFPNGVILWPNQKTLVVADTRSLNLWAYRIEPDGSLKYKQPYYTMRGVLGRSGSGADGMTVDNRGRLFVATYAGLQMFDPTGRICGIILKPQNRFLSNVVIGGKNKDHFFVTCSDKVYRRRIKSRAAK